MQNNDLQVVVVYQESEPSHHSNTEHAPPQAQLPPNQLAAQKPPDMLAPPDSVKPQYVKDNEAMPLDNPYIEDAPTPQQPQPPAQAPKEEVKEIVDDAKLEKDRAKEPGAQFNAFNVIREESKEQTEGYRDRAEEPNKPVSKVNLIFDVADIRTEQAAPSVEQQPQLQRQQPPPLIQESTEASELPTASQETSHKGNRVIGIIILSLMGGIFWLYGWASEYHVVTMTSVPVALGAQSIYAALLIFGAIFTVLGFGMLFMYFKKTSQSALFTSLFIVSFTMIASPFCHKFWYNVFINDFSGTVISTNNPHYLFNQSMGNTNILLDLYNMKFSLVTAISQLVVILALFGKLSATQLTVFSILYNFGWSLNHYALINLQAKSKDLRIFDDYSISSVYLFAACFGAIAMAFLKKPPAEDHRIQSNEQSVIFAQVGTFFLFLTFCATTIIFPQKNSEPTLVRNFVPAQAFINCFFALSAAVLFSYAFSILFNGKIAVRDSVFGVIGGGIIYGSVAGFVTNIGAAIGCGLGAGFFSAIFYRFIYPKINRKKVIDTYGLFLILFISILATTVIPPIVIFLYEKYSIVVSTLQVDSSSKGGVVSTKQLAEYVLIYPAVSIGIGCGAGFLVSLLLKILDTLDADRTLTDKLFFISAHGLRPTKLIEKGQKLKPSLMKKLSSAGKKDPRQKGQTRSNVSNDMLNSQQCLQISVRRNKVSDPSQTIQKGGTANGK